MNRRKIITLVVLGDVILAALVLAWWLGRPGFVDAAAWRPPPAPALSGPTAANQALLEAHILAQGQLVGPEDIAVDAVGDEFGDPADLRRDDGQPGRHGLHERVGHTLGEARECEHRRVGEVAADLVLGLVADEADGVADAEVACPLLVGRPVGAVSDHDERRVGSAGDDLGHRLEQDTEPLELGDSGDEHDLAPVRTDMVGDR